eukprot:TRINITY_DN3612_c0_g1_i1.p1 TRINITY_DN3612_c0_g1~~TRINITY_DN3612_c0_g1_i1.p1  ORF type:complete len:747 (-),score=149.79 TRINITY_DN3612_c0_g1_i1:76-2283(-)
MGVVKQYLILFNALSALGWAYVLVSALQNYTASVPVDKFWNSYGYIVIVVQSLATLEIFHSLLSIVPSPFLTTFLQVSSRLALTWFITPNSPSAQHHFSLYLMILSWSLVEVPRYLFYAASQALSGNVPYPLFWLRYSLFAILYPTGISGELGQIWSSLKDAKKESLVLWYLLALLLIVYVPASPYMYYHMIGQRKRAFEKLNAPPPTVTYNGLEFPIDTKTGQPSSTIINKGAFAASIREISPDKAKRIDSEKNWRFNYDRYVLDHVTLCLADPKECQKICQSGLDYLHRSFDFYRDGQRVSFAQAMKNIKGSFHTGIIKGDKPLASKSPFVVPYKNKDLKGQELLDQLDKWAQYGTIESSARDSIAMVVNNEDWLDLSDQYFVLLGAGSAMGPLHVLLSLGANIIAIDLDREGIWNNLINQAKNSPGTLYFPLKKPQSELTPDQYAKNAGCNLFTQTPEIKNWINQVEPDKPLVVGGYAYLDGALHVKVALAMDAIMAGLCESRKNVTLAFLCTPTDVHVITEEAYKAQHQNYQNVPFWQKLIEKIPRSGLRKSQLKPVSGKGGPYKIVDGLVIQQGPNYALAKRLQHWRAVIARGNKVRVSSNVAPSTSTPSVVSNKQFAAAYAEMHRFVPMEIFGKETSNAVMGALLIHDIRNPKSISNPQTETTNPLQLFQIGSFHGGIWRTGYHFGELGFYSALIYYIREYLKPALFVSLAFVVSFVAVIYQNGLPHTW